VGDIRGAVSVGELVRTKLLSALEKAAAAETAATASR
jgi:hypothetical protein